MGVWDIYYARPGRKGADRRDLILKREQDFIRRKLPLNLSYKTLLINGQEQNAAVISSDNLDTKTICSLPNEDFPHGGLVYWMDQHWLITGKDADNEVYTRGTMRQCNHLLKWVNDEGKIVERWCIVEDGTKLKHIEVCNGLAYWKRYAKRIPLIAGTPLEPYGPQHSYEIWASVTA